MINLLDETIKVLATNNKATEDVLWVGSEDVSVTWQDFERLADREYDEGYGSAMVAQDLRIVGDNWWLERGEYDGREWWEFKELFKKPIEKEVTALFYTDFSSPSLKELNGY